jgi:hypothetical protein
LQFPFVAFVIFVAFVLKIPLGGNYKKHSNLCWPQSQKPAFLDTDEFKNTIRPPECPLRRPRRVFDSDRLPQKRNSHNQPRIRHSQKTRDHFRRKNQL